MREDLDNKGGEQIWNGSREGYGTYVSVTVEESKSEAAGAELGLDDVLFILPPGQRNDLGVVLPWLLTQHGSDKQLQV